MNLVTLDFETFFDTNYTLSSMTTEEYIRDPRFKTHMMGMRFPEGTKQAFPGTGYAHYGLPQNDTPQLRAWQFEQCFMGCAEDYAANVGIIAHHAHFDGLILAHHYGITPAFWFDTLSMARLVFPHARSHSLGALSELLGFGKKDMDYLSFKGVRDLPPELYNQVAAGCLTDIELTYKIFTAMLPYVPRDELRIIDQTVRLFTEPHLKLDRPRMEQYSQALAYKKQTLLDRLGVDKKQLGSNDKFAALLVAIGEEPETKPGKNGPIYAFAKNDDYMRALLESDNEETALLAEARIDTKSTGNQSRAERLLGMDARGPLAIYINYCGAHTLRDSGGDSTNFQNMKRIDFDDKGQVLEGMDQRGWIRLSLLAPEGYVIVVVDASQIECRLLNWHAGQQDVLDKFASKVDIYSDLASMFYGFPVTKKNKAERGTGKQLELSAGFGAGGATIVRTAKLGTYGPPVMLTDAQGKAARDLYRATHPEVVQHWAHAQQVILPMLLDGKQDFMWGPLRVYGQRIYGPDGTWLDYSNLQYGYRKEDSEKPEYYTTTRKGTHKMYGGLLVENVTQYMGRAIMMAAALQIGAKYKVVMRTHDEVAYLATVDDAPAALEFGLNIMKTPPAWCSGIPLDAEGGYDVRYSK